MKTKTVEYWCDLYPGWHLRGNDHAPGIYSHTQHQFPNTKRVRILIDLPCVEVAEGEPIVAKVDGDAK